MADITIDNSVHSTLFYSSGRGGPFWTTLLIGYVIYRDAGESLVYSKTTDGGATWAAANLLVAGPLMAHDCWADWQTAGDAGTKIHIACVDANSDTLMYVYLDTSDDSEGTDTIEVCQGSGVIWESYGWASYAVSITKTRGGNLAVAAHYSNNVPNNFYVFYTSPDGDTWTSKTSPWEADRYDFIQLYPANLADNQDLWAAFWDVSADEISLKTFDNSGNSWSEATIGTSMTESPTFCQMAGAIRLSDGHLIFMAWSQFDSATADLMCWDITDAGTITAKTNLITDTSEYFLASVFINQGNDDIYVAYVGGATAAVDVHARYQVSDDGGGSWSGDTQYSVTNDDHRWISCGAVKAAWGGRFEPVWFNDDLNDLFTNFDNSVSIAAESGGGVTVTPGPFSVTLTPHAPIITASDHKTVTPGKVDMSITNYAPVITASDHKEVVPGAVAMSLTPKVPEVTASDFKLVTPGALPLTLTPKTPVVTASDHKTVTPGKVDLTMTPYAPVVTASNHKEVVPGTVAMSLTPKVPVITASDFKLVTPGALPLTLTPHAPTISVTGNKEVVPGTFAMTLTPYAPVITASDHKEVVPGIIALTLTPKTPVVTASDHKEVIPGTLALVMTPNAPVITASDKKVVTPGTLAMTLTTLAPSVFTPVVVTPGTVALTLTPYTPTIYVPIVVTPGTLEMILTTFTPTITASEMIIITANCYFHKRSADQVFHGRSADQVFRGV